MKKEKKVWALTLIAFWALSPNKINAQQQDSVRTLDELTITGTRTEQPVIEVPRSVTVVSREMIQRSVYNSVADLLSTEAGIYIVGATQTPGTNQSIFMRGANSNQVVVMLNGMRITDPSSPNGAIDFSEISLTDIERIEIIRGAHSTLYGGSAIGGAINIITRKGGATGFHGNGSLQGGTFGHGSFAGNENVNLNYKLKSGLYFTGGAFNQHVNGLNATEDTITTSTYKTSDKDAFNKTDYFTRAGYTSGRWDVYISGKRSDQHAEIDDRAYDDDDNSYLDFTRNLLEYSAGYKINENLKAVFSGSMSKSRRYLQNDSSKINAAGDYDKTFIDGLYHGRLSTNEIVLHHTYGNLKSIFGLGQYREKMNFQTYYFSNAFGFPFEQKVNYDSIKIAAETSYAFAQVSYEKNNFNIQAGTRYNRHSLAGNFFTFEISPSFRLRNTLVYVSASTGFNSPSLYQLYDPTFGLDASLTRGNRDLKAERSLSLELGFKKEYNNGSYFTLSAYSSLVRNDIEYVYLWNKEVPISDLTYEHYIGDTYLNISKQLTKGVELAGRWNISKVYLQGNVSVMEGEVTISPDDVSVSETQGHHVQLYNYGPFVSGDITVSSLARRPNATGYAELGFKPTPALTIFSSLRHTGSRNDVEYNEQSGPFGALGQRNVKSYDLIDAGASYQVNGFFSILAKIENIFGENYREINGFQTRGRSAYLKLQFRW